MKQTGETQQFLQTEICFSNILGMTLHMKDESTVVLTSRDRPKKFILKFYQRIYYEILSICKYLFKKYIKNLTELLL